MSFNPDRLQTRLPALDGFGILALSGPDAAAFAQAQFMNHVGALQPGRWQWSGWLTPKGRVVALFALLRLAEDRFWLVLPDYPAVELAAGLRRYVFRSKVDLATRVDWIACADPEGCASEAPTDPAAFLGDEETGLLLDLGGEGGARHLALLPREHAMAAPAQPEVDAAWRLFDLRHGWPRLDAGQVEAWTPHMLSLDRLNAFSVKKGCYPGQEIVARTHFLGQAKRGLVRLSGAAPMPEAPEVQAIDGSRLGEIVCRASAGDRFEVLAVLPLEPAVEGARIGGEAVRTQPLLGGLAR